jgi:hypothetical protein
VPGALRLVWGIVRSCPDPRCEHCRATTAHRGAPDKDAVPASTEAALGTSWTVGPVEVVAGRMVKLHGRWSNVTVLRVLVDAPAG